MDRLTIKPIFTMIGGEPQPGQDTTLPINVSGRLVSISSLGGYTCQALRWGSVPYIYIYAPRCIHLPNPWIHIQWHRVIGRHRLRAKTVTGYDGGHRLRARHAIVSSRTVLKALGLQGVVRMLLLLHSSVRAHCSGTVFGGRRAPCFVRQG